MNISSTISHEKAIRYLNAARAYACIISNCEKKVGYNAVESLFTDTCKLGGISLNDTICVITEVPCIKSMRLLLRSGISTIVTIHQKIHDNEMMKLIEKSKVELIVLNIFW